MGVSAIPPLVDVVELRRLPLKDAVQWTAPRLPLEARETERVKENEETAPRIRRTKVKSYRAKDEVEPDEQAIWRTSSPSKLTQTFPHLTARDPTTGLGDEKIREGGGCKGGAEIWQSSNLCLQRARPASWPFVG